MALKMSHQSLDAGGFLIDCIGHRWQQFSIQYLCYYRKLFHSHNSGSQCETCTNCTERVDFMAIREICSVSRSHTQARNVTFSIDRNVTAEPDLFAIFFGVLNRKSASFHHLRNYRDEEIESIIPEKCFCNLSKIARRPI